MKRLIVTFLTVVMCLSLAACGGNISGDNANNAVDESTEVSATETKVQNESSTQTNGLTDKEVIGTWEWKNFDEQGPANGVTHMELYEGGTGKGTNSEMTDGNYLHKKIKVEKATFRIVFRFWTNRKHPPHG